MYLLSIFFYQIDSFIIRVSFKILNNLYFQIPIKTHEEFINFEIDLLFASPIISAMADRGKKRGRGKT